MTHWRLWQLADSAFPTGGFAHSGGLEASLRFDREDVGTFTRASVWQAGTFALPFVRESFGADDGRLIELDRLCDVSQASHVARRASRLQGRSLSLACARSFSIARSGAQHLPVATGDCLGRLGIELRDAQAWFLFVTARGILSAAVRLGRLQPTESQRLLDALPMSEVLDACGDRGIDDVSHSAPLIDILTTLHDHLPARLFQS